MQRPSNSVSAMISMLTLCVRACMRVWVCGWGVCVRICASVRVYVYVPVCVRA